MQADRLLELMRQRRSVREYQARDVPPALVARLVDAARWAPSAGNQQAWYLYEVRAGELRERLAGAARGQQVLVKAPVVLIVAVDEAVAAANYGERGVRLYAVQDSAAAIQNLLLMAHALGLASCWVGSFDEDAVRRLLPASAPRRLRPVALVTIGYAAETPTPPPRRPVEELLGHVR